MTSGKYGTPMRIVRVKPKHRGKKRLTWQERQERSWAKKAGEVRTGRLEDLPADDPRRA